MEDGHSLEEALPGLEAYLEAIYVLTVESAAVTSAQVAHYLGVTPVSVSRALDRMERRQLLQSRTPQVRLTEKGWRWASAVVRRHRLAERWLADRLGLDLITAHREAERIEHALSPRVEEALWEDLGRPATCPHGNPIPDAEGRIPPLARAIALRDAPPGMYRVDRIFEQLEGLEPLLRFVEEAGLLPGRWVQVEKAASGEGQGEPTVRVEGKEGAVRVPQAVARFVLVEPWAAEGGHQA
jgi:DtxR family Mn-dependent transcriptional regulator